MIVKNVDEDVDGKVEVELGCFFLLKRTAKTTAMTTIMRKTKQQQQHHIFRLLFFVFFPSLPASPSFLSFFLLPQMVKYCILLSTFCFFCFFGFSVAIVESENLPCGYCGEASYMFLLRDGDRSLCAATGGGAK